MFSCVFVTFPCGGLGQVRYLIVLIPDLCLFPYFLSIHLSVSSIHLYCKVKYITGFSFIWTWKGGMINSHGQWWPVLDEPRTPKSSLEHFNMICCCICFIHHSIIYSCNSLQPNNSMSRPKEWRHRGSLRAYREGYTSPGNSIPRVDKPGKTAPIPVQVCKYTSQR